MFVDSAWCLIWGIGQARKTDKTLENVVGSVWCLICGIWWAQKTDKALGNVVGSAWCLICGIQQAQQTDKALGNVVESAWCLICGIRRAQKTDKALGNVVASAWCLICFQQCQQPSNIPGFLLVRKCILCLTLLFDSFLNMLLHLKDSMFFLVAQRYPNDGFLIQIVSFQSSFKFLFLICDHYKGVS